MQVAIIGGGGTVGSTVAYTLASTDPTVEVVLVDVDEGTSHGHTIDIRHARAHAGHPVGRLGGTTTPAGVRSVGTDEVGELDPAVVVVAASAPRPAGSAQRGGRMAFLERNRAVADDVADQLRRLGPRPVIGVTNPLDRILYRLWRATGWPRERFVGYSLSEQARVADAIARRRGVGPEKVSCPVIGEHGEHVVPVFSRALVGGEPATFPAEEREAITEEVRDAPYNVIRLRGREDSSRWVSGRGIALLVSAILAGGPDEPIPLSVPLDGEYGFNDVCLGVPVEISSTGVDRIVEWELTEEEQSGLEAAYRAVAADCES